jgi:DNA-binding GntR family transcriptional regulator
MATERGERAIRDTADHSHKAYNGIRRMLYNKELVPGQKIAYRDLAEQLEMSPTPIIQALKWLEIQGLVRHAPNRGYYIEPFSLQELEEIYELRELLELALLPVAIERLDEEGAQQLRHALKAHLSAEREFYLKERLFKNMEFHLTLAALAKKELHLSILRNIFDLLFLKYGGNYLPLASLTSVDQEHQEIFDCVVARNREGAQVILARHISNVKEQVLQSLRRMLEEQEDLRGTATEFSRVYK